MHKKKITYVISKIKKAVAFEWIANNLSKEKFELSFILIDDQKTYLFEWLKQNNFKVEHIYYSGKSDLVSGVFKLLIFFLRNRPDVVHTHLFDANLLGLIVSRLLFIKQRIYTRHHSTFHHEYFPKAVKWDKIINGFATDIVAISENVKNVLIKYEDVDPRKIRLIHHGFDFNEFNNVSDNRVERIKKKHGITTDKRPIIGVISRYTEWKGIQYIIPAFKSLLDIHPNALLVLANANGPDKMKIEELLIKNIAAKNYTQITFENDLFALYKLFDIYIHVPINNEIEAFGQTYVEALASGIPSVFTLSGVAKEFIKNEYNALVVDYNESRQIADAMDRLLQDQQLKEALIENGLNTVARFSLVYFIQKLTLLYE